MGSPFLEGCRSRRKRRKRRKGRRKRRRRRRRKEEGEEEDEEGGEGGGQEEEEEREREELEEIETIRGIQTPKYLLSGPFQKGFVSSSSCNPPASSAIDTTIIPILQVKILRP